MRSADKDSRLETLRPAGGGGDYSEYVELSQRLDSLLEDMAKVAESYADARAALEFSSDRRKTALADAFVAIRDANPEEAAGSAEHRARNSAKYKDALRNLFAQEVACETQVRTYELLRTRVDVARSRMAVVRAMIEIISVMLAFHFL
jgi:hypothetical protein